MSTAKKKVGIIQFLGTNCDRDVALWIKNQGLSSEYIWFENQFNPIDYEMIILPGGFSYGDYLRTGALAARTPVMKSVREAAHQGRKILGICNGFQILCEAGLLPGVLLKNESLKFNDLWVNLHVKSTKSVFSKSWEKNQTLKLPVAHGDGRYYADSETLKALWDQQQVWLTYENNPNGSLMDIAGITNEKGHVCGLMPHPERAQALWMGSTDGQLFLEA